MYKPNLVPDDDIKSFLQNELRVISEEMMNLQVSSILSEIHYNAPDKPREGLIMNFDSSVHGISGLYEYRGGAWVKL